MLVVGGSLGAEALNEALPKALSQVAAESVRAWSTRPARSTSRRLQKQLSRRPASRRKCVAFIDDMAAATPRPTW